MASKVFVTAVKASYIGNNLNTEKHARVDFKKRGGGNNVWAAGQSSWGFEPQHDPVTVVSLLSYHLRKASLAHGFFNVVGIILVAPRLG